MFTGLITDIGEVTAARNGGFMIGCGYDLTEENIGASICCDGCCLTTTAVEPGRDGFKSVFSVDVSNETFARTTLGTWTMGHKVNLERALTPASELGGHIVTGHVDGIANVLERKQDGQSARFIIEVGKELAQFIAEKGSVALNGVSLTVNEVKGSQFGVNLIPHTLKSTTWSKLEAGGQVNLEVDLLARYVARITRAKL